MKILFVSSGNNNGISPITKRQGESLSLEGMQVSHFLITGKGIISYLKSIIKLKKFLRNNNFEIIHSHYAFSGYVSYFAHSKEKLVLSFMGDDLLGTNDKYGRITFKSTLITLINRTICYILFDKIIVKSLQMKSYLKNSDKIEIIPNGVNLNKFYPLNQIECQKILDLNSKNKHVVFISNPKRHEKNYELAKSACNQLNNKNLELHAIYNSNVKELNYYYNAADLILLTSFHEGSPNVIKEAMACNCPIVSTEVGDVAKIIDGINGCYLTNYDSSFTAQTILKSIDFREKHKYTNGRDRIINLGLDSKSIALKLISIYQSIVIQ